MMLPFVQRAFTCQPVQQQANGSTAGSLNDTELVAFWSAARPTGARCADARSASHACNSCCMRVAIHVRPGSSAARVGGAHDGALVVRVHERAIDGKATEAALCALASALEVRRRDIDLITGATSRVKVVEIPDSTAERFRELRDSAQK